MSLVTALHFCASEDLPDKRSKSCGGRQGVEEDEADIAAVASLHPDQLCRWKWKSEPLTSGIRLRGDW